MLPLLAFASCINPIEFDYESEPVVNKLVLHSLLTSEESISLQLSASRFFLDENYTFRKISNADIYLLKDGVIIDTLRHSTNSEDDSMKNHFVYGENAGVYFSDYIPQENDNLKIQASAPGFEPVESEITVVPPPDLVMADTAAVECWAHVISTYENDVLTKDTVIINFSGNVTLNFNDTPDKDEYFYIHLYVKTDYINGTSLNSPLAYHSNDVVFSTTGVSFDMLGETETEKNYGVFTDELFAGKNYTIKLNCTSERNYWTATDILVDAQYLVAELHSVSKEYYLYRKTAMIADDEMGGMFSEPAQIFSNIKGGIGVMGSYNISRKTFKLTRSCIKEIIDGIYY
jgi:hypothetical protein